MNRIFSKAPPVIGLALVLSVTVACGNNPDAETEFQASEMSKTNPSTVPVQMNAAEQVAHARADLAGRLGIDPAAVTVSGSGPVTWRSGALGCPKPGMNYTQALVPGFRITLRVDQTPYHYHAKSGGQPFFCPADRTESPSQNGAYE